MEDKHSRGGRWALDVTPVIAKRLLESLQADTAHLGDTSAAGALARGRAFAIAAYHDQAIDSFKEALALDPCQHEAAARLVLVLLRTRRHEEALAAAMKLAANAPEYQMRELTSDEHIGSFTLLGNALVQVGRVDDAVQAYEAARRINDRDTTAAARLAQLHLAAGEPKRALAEAEAFAGNPRFRDLAAVLNLGRTSEALLPQFQKARVADILALTDHGRPLSVDGSARVAPLVVGDASWCGVPVGDAEQ